MSYVELKAFINSKPGPVSNIEIELIRAFLSRFSTEALINKLRGLTYQRDLTKSERVERDVCREIIASRRA